ncbi:G2/M phase-specific E3 ubiquitin-protein ligase-like isoform X2 [Argopecten irradians]|uniref:G2/M phase-specific E3 ubiquitin-protein ligase-like isoform X2 n=1 Tax=Argopecten irradians TaxID=31199 RepID=UPI0037183498
MFSAFSNGSSQVLTKDFSTTLWTLFEWQNVPAFSDVADFTSDGSDQENIDQNIEESDHEQTANPEEVEETDTPSIVFRRVSRPQESDDFDETDTPTICFRRQPHVPRNRLTLQRRRLPPIEGTSTDTEELQRRRLPPIEGTSTDMEELPDLELQNVADPVTLNTDQTDVGPEELTLTGILKWWVNKTIIPGEESMILVSRENILKSTLRFVRRDNFNFCRKFKVAFSGEEGEDLGGPKREFLRLLMKDVVNDCFHGHGENMFFQHDLDKLSKNSFEIAGSLVAFSLLHGGPGIPVLNEPLFNLLVTGDCENLPKVDECILDADQRQNIQTIMQASDQATYSEAIGKISEWAVENGLSVHNFRSFEDKTRLIEILIKNEIFYNVNSEMEQFKRGLNKVGLFLTTVQMAPETLKSLFVFAEEPLSFVKLRQMYRINYSPEGSNDRRQENTAVYCLEAFLADTEGGTTGVTFQDILSFWTGAIAPPPLGLTKKLEVDFGPIKRLPSAHTCGLILNLWRGYSDPDDFARDMVKSVTWGGGFHLV